jgi:hypothetical protein
MSDQSLLKWKPEVNMGNVVSWSLIVIGIVGSYVNTQRDISELIKNDQRVDLRIEKVEGKTDALKDDFGDMKADIRVIRQILENGGRVAK